MSLYADIRAGLVANLAPLKIQSTGYLLQSPTPPAIEIFPGVVTYDRTMARGLDEVLFTVRITVGAGLEQGAQDNLDSYLERTGTNSVKTLIESDLTLGGKVKSLHVEEATGHQVSTVGPGPVLSASWSVRIYL